MLRHSTFQDDVESIIEKGLLPEGVRGDVLRPYDNGWVSFEKDPPTDWLTSNLPRLKPRASSRPTIALDFDEDRIRSDFVVKDHPRVAINDLCPAFFGTEAEVLQNVGITVKVRPEPGHGIPLEYLTAQCKNHLRSLGYKVS